MPKPATLTPAEISYLADRLTKLNREERFSWEAAAALNEVGIKYRTGNPWTTTNLAKAVSEVHLAGAGTRRPSEKPNTRHGKPNRMPQRPRRTRRLLPRWEAMPRGEPDELLDQWRWTDELSGTTAARFLSRSGNRKLMRGGT